MKNMYNFFKRILSHNKFVYNFVKKFYIKHKNNIHFIPIKKEDIERIFNNKKTYNLDLPNL